MKILLPILKIITKILYTLYTIVIGVAIYELSHSILFAIIAGEAFEYMFLNNVNDAFSRKEKQ